MVATGLSAPPLSPCTAEVWETERWFPLSGWGRRRLPTDRAQWSSRDGVQSAQPADDAATPPSGCWWAGAWEVGPWEYALDYPQELYTANKGVTDCVRRRRWTRVYGTGGQRSEEEQDVVTVPGADTSLTGLYEVDAVVTWGALDELPEGTAARLAVDQGQLFLLTNKGDAKAARVIELADVSEVRALHSYATGVPFCVGLTLDEGKGHPVRVVSPHEAQHERVLKVLRLRVADARGFKGLKNAGNGAAALAGKGLKIAAGFFAGAAGASAGNQVGGAAGRKMARGMGLS